MMRAFVTGAAGFVGSHLTELLLDRGREVFGLILDRRDAGNLTDALAGAHASHLHLIEGDLLEASFLAGAVREIRPDEVYHLAAQPSVRQSTADPAGTFRINVLGTQGLLEAVREASGRPRVLYVGSAEAYGESARLGGPLTEERPLLPVTPYGSSKAAAEQVACPTAQSTAWQSSGSGPSRTPGRATRRASSIQTWRGSSARCERAAVRPGFWSETWR
jgi:nucleoside-diphosphate-sugar epimerase